MLIIETYNVLKILFYTSLLLFLIFAYISNRSKANNSIQAIAFWVAIFSILIVTYAFRFELNFIKDRVLAVLIPSYSWTDQHGKIVIARNSDSHFYINAIGKSNKRIRFLVDTGATDVALTKEDAIKLGLNIKNLKYTKKYSTANGASYAAPVRIDQLTIENKIFYNIEAHITDGGLDVSLLGMSLIERFKDFKITQDLLIFGY